MNQSFRRVLKIASLLRSRILQVGIFLPNGRFSKAIRAKSPGFDDLSLFSW